ncbi:hypothetical protein SEA_KIPPER29_68 [Mycobacterium phage Kipper29]|uniref:Uncharacterized protein n=2 Tax=Gladiatorvirus ericB TaxID=1041406 RepID=G1EBT9_9CAUD|nr:hypothetical protein AXJ19_gp044 [Mycobacterium phage VohminGhazi]YP_009637871.1 hypothetical protein FGG32_gp042 [Mycobacterium phage EricB]AMW64417.1 hypothetical protein PBI_KAZAN_69 [Mycobacterium phage Kazan]QDF15849.1 hypothetical protein SEA_KIPPER29_68 [Mycobacterium phage Kipper29]QXO14819.1 hypothetical protein SEA_SMELLYB_68 [Mycobacterium phage SmellyB]QYW01267.1 hypothetical protein SEA_HOOT_63 [Mycobacterium phage Hoot]AEJ93366.1 hypothetical protein ERICB_67 [Mycobacterium p
MKTLKEQLIGVKDQLIEHGRNDMGYLKDDNGCLCLLGAAAAEVYGYDQVVDHHSTYGLLEPGTPAGPVVAAIADQIRDKTSFGSTNNVNTVFMFNDRTPVFRNAEVFAVIDAAIEVAE